MKKIKESLTVKSILTVILFFLIIPGVNAGEIPKIIIDGSEVRLTIPYIEVLMPSGVKQAYKMVLSTDGTSSDLAFYIDWSSFQNVSLLPSGNEESLLGIEPVPSSLGKAYTDNFDRYTKVAAPNGKFIHIVAQSNITVEQIIRARGVLEHYLRAYPGSQYGNTKEAVANKMAENNATLLLLNGSDGDSSVPEVNGQPLYENEIQVEGHAWYINQNYEEHRDATFEEILHLVHDYGIGVDGDNSVPGALPEFQKEIRAAQNNALQNGLWGIGVEDWIKELGQENSLSQEYLASLIDSYYGLWGAWGNGTHGMWGLYMAKTRSEIISEDPIGQGLLENKFFHPYLTYNARIDSGFSGTFSLKFDPAIPYTHHSRYLKDITLLGDRNTNVKVNTWNNDITGNSGINTIIFSGNYSEYTITTESNQTIVIDSVNERDGENRIKESEKLQFLDQTVEL